MYKNFFLLLALILFTGCAERGYKLTSHAQTHTAIAESSTDIDASNKELPKTLKKMKNAVKNELKNKHVSVKNTKKIIKTKSESIFIPTLNKKIKNSSTVNRYKPVISEDKLLTSSTEDLIFKRVNNTYQKFGNSEIHGHVIYLSNSGLETTLKNSKIYLLTINKTLNNWYNNSYLKNNRQSTYGTKVEYLNQTYLNLSKNFAFHGIAPGEYFVIIVSDNPKYDTSNKKVYIAKKIKVEKRKKIMAVFSKKL
jgi:hypothetical protein